MNNINPHKSNTSSLRYAIFAPLALMIAAFASCCHSYSSAKQNLTDDLNDAMIALANEKSELWTRQDTITALRQMHKTTQKPLIYQASDLNFRNAALKDKAYFTIALVDRKNYAPKILSRHAASRFVSDSIMLIPEKAIDGLVIQVQGFANCSMASIFAASDQTLPGILFTLSVLSMASICVCRRKESEVSDAISSNSTTISFNGIKLTPMQRQFTQMLLNAPNRKVDKATLCAIPWDNKSNANEAFALALRTQQSQQNKYGAKNSFIHSHVGHIGIGNFSTDIRIHRFPCPRTSRNRSDSQPTCHKTRWHYSRFNNRRIQSPESRHSSRCT